MISPIIRWICSNKLLVFFGVATFCFFVSTIALSTQNKALKRSVISDKHKQHQDENITEIESNRYRLPKHVRPTHYNLKLNPDFTKKVFEGEVKITLNISKPVKFINLHAKDLDIQTVEVKSITQNIPVVSTKLLLSSEIFQVNLQEEIGTVDYELHLTFTGKLDNGIVGFYASTMRNGE